MMGNLRVITIRIFVCLAIAQASHSAPQETRNIAASLVSNNNLRKSKASTTHARKDKRKDKNTPGPNVAPMPSHTHLFDTPPMFFQQCNEVHNLDIGDSAVFFSAEGFDKIRCKYRFKSPEESIIKIECPIFELSRDGCKKESFIINERGKKKKDFCKTSKPILRIGSSNRLTVAYRRNKESKEKKDNDKTRGYICRAFAIRKDPPTTTSTTIDSMSSTIPPSRSTTASTPALSTIFSWFPTQTTSSSSSGHSGFYSWFSSEQKTDDDDTTYVSSWITFPEILGKK